MCGGKSHWFKQPQDEVWLESIVKTHVKMLHAAETLEEPDEFEEPRGMVVIDAYSVYRSPSFTRLFQSAQTDAEPH